MNKQSEDIKAIRKMMEKSSKFLSLNGLSLFFAGVIACAGAAFAYFYLLRNPAATDYNRTQEIMILLVDALIVLALSVGIITFFCWQKSKKNHQSLFNSVTQRAAYNLLVPLFVGGIFCLVQLLRGNIDIAVSSTLLFYGLALLNASKFTFDEVHYLGIAEIALGLLAVVFPFPHNGILLWAIGFGVCHIVCGAIMYFKYEKEFN